MKDLTDEEKLALAAAEALRGAGDVRKRLSLEMSSGTPSISDLAYAIKTRLKEDYRIVDKVKRKRLEKPYGVDDLRDIVGLRIVTLYRLDAIDVIPILLDRIFDNSGNDESNLFLNKPVEEVKVFSLNPLGDVQNLVGRIRPLFAARGLSDRFYVEDKSSSYTSIHIVAWCRGKYRNQYRSIPVEIQVRTAFEDVWGEIDHSLKYKPPEDDHPAPMEEAQRENILAHLNVMKAMIDGMAQYADQIKIQIDEPKESFLKVVRLRLAEKPTERIKAMSNIPDRLDEAITAAIGSSRMCFERLSSPNSQPGRAITAKRRAIDELKSVIDEVRNVPGLVEGDRAELLYLLEMERALLLLAYGSGLAGWAGNQALVEASRVYSRLEEQFPKRALVQYRLARSLDALGDTLAAQLKLEQLIANIDAMELPPTHWVRAAARRVLGVLYWKQSVRIMEQPHAVGDTVKAAEATRLIAQAYAITKQGLTLQVDEERDPDERDGTERDKAVNNLLYYALELFGDGKERSISEASYQIGDIGKYIEYMEGTASNEARDYRHVDTLRKAYEFVGNEGKALDAAREVEAMLHARGVVDRGGTSREEVMLRAAQRLTREAEAPEDLLEK
jgi:ppGpp synthetase/RelA/SpoT-type nucleotidyltranferase